MVTLGTDGGFVTSQPTSTPSGSNNLIDYYSRVTGDTAPAGYTKITEVGWYCNSTTSDEDFQIGLYSADGTEGNAGTRLYVSTGNAKGTTTGWKRVAVDWTITPGTKYWIGVSLPNTSIATYTLGDSSGGGGVDYRYANVTLDNPYNGGYQSDTNGIYAFYALVSATGTNTKINIGDSWKEITAAKINISDDWKEITSMKINIGDTWKTIF